jgi:PAS domain S-box-containing protein
MAQKKSIPVRLSQSVAEKALQTLKNRQTTDLKPGLSSSRSKSKTTTSNKEPDTFHKRAEKELILERNIAQEYLDIAGVFLVGINADQEVTFINKKGCEILGYKKHEVIGRNWFDTFIPSEIKENVRDAFKKLISAKIEPVKFFENAVLTSNGTERIIAWENTVIRDKEGNIVSTLSSGEDITARKAAEDILINTLEESQQRQAEISALLKGSHAVLKYHDFKSAAQSIFNSCKKLVGATSGYVALLSKGGTENEVVFLDSGGLSCRVDPRLPMPIRGLRAGACHNKKAVYHNDFQNSEWMKFMPEGHSKLRNVLFAPMIVAGKVVGLLGLGNKPKGFNENDCRMATAFAQIAAIALTQKNAEEALRKSEMRHRSYIDVTEQLGWTTNAEGVVVEDIPSWRKFTGQSQENIKGRGWSKAIHPDDLDNTARVWRNAVATKNRYEAEYRIRRYDGVYRHFFARGVPVFEDDGNIREWVGTCIDITERKKAEQTLRESREDLKRAQAVAQTGSWRMDIQRNELVWSDENWRIFGVAKGTPLTYETFLSTVHPDDREYVNRKWMAALQGEHYDIEHRIVVVDTIRWVRERAELEFDKKGILLGGFGTTQDITEKKYVEERLREAKEALQKVNEELESKVQDRTEELIESREQLRSLLIHIQSVREAERTHIAREIHDEFGTILTALKIDLSWLEKKFTEEQESLKEKTSKSLDLINSAIKTVQKISSQLRPGILDHLGLASAIEWEVKEFGNRTGVKWDLSIDIGERNLDRDMSTTIFRILQETLTNIVRHAEASLVSVSLNENGSCLMLQVKDNGKGITEEELTDPRSYGLMGMRERVQSWDGSIMISGMENKGTTVTVSIPLDNKGQEK